MSNKTRAANSSFDRAESDVTDTIKSFVDTVSDALESSEADEDLVEAVESEGKAVAETVGETVGALREDVDDQPDVEVDDTNPLESLTIADAPVGKAITSKASKTDVERAIESVEPQPQDKETTRQEPDSTPIERLAVSDDIEEVTDSVSVERAVSLFRNLKSWGSKTPKGVVLRPKDNPLQLLEAERDENLYWRSYYRAAKVLERLSKGAITFFDSDRHGKILVLHQQSDVYDRVNGGSTTSSTARAET